jgi:GT2 family glycosyltransferase
MNKLAVIIVSYNVKYFLEQCLQSVFKALEYIDAEVWVVDNNSVDDSVAMVRDKFPTVKLIANTENSGFSKANNQAMRLANAQYMLLLNPDTVVEEDTFKKCIDFMDNHPEAGGLGVYMQDGKGNFLPESKRGLPTPEVAFYKIFGFSRLFPNSRKFGKYHLSYLDKNKTCEVEILAGAFMMMRHETLQQTGLLDEAFFMYGEDIDLSYRILKAGYKNYYFADTKIIHYKGESTKKSSVNYVFVFYNAMIIFARKHFSQQHAGLFSFLIHAAIYFRASLAIIKRFFQTAFLPAVDASALFGILFLLKNYWETVKASEGLHFHPHIIYIHFPVFVLSLILSVKVVGGYQKPIRLNAIYKGVLWGSILILILYSLLPENLRFSRAVVLLGMSFSLIYFTISRYLFDVLKIKSLSLDKKQMKKMLIAGSESEFQRICDLLKISGLYPEFIARVSVGFPDNKEANVIGNISQLKEMVEIYKINEVIFCAKDITAQNIMNIMQLLGDTDTDYKIAPPESMFIIGSNSIDTNGEFYTIPINSITKKSNLDKKRWVDLLLATILLPIVTIGFPLFKSKLNVIRMVFKVMIGKYSFVGIHQDDSKFQIKQLKPGIFQPSDAINKTFQNAQTKHFLQQLYVKDYKPSIDIKIVLRNLFNL